MIGISVKSEFQFSNRTPPECFVHKTIFQIRTCDQIGGFENRISIPRFFILRSPLVFLRVEMKFLTSLFTTRQNTPLLSCTIAVYGYSLTLTNRRSVTCAFPLSSSTVSSTYRYIVVSVNFVKR